MNEVKNICVFASSSNGLHESYFRTAAALGEAMARRGIGLVFGGGRLGLMGAVAQSVQKQNGSIVGVIPERLHQPGVAFPGCTKLIVTKTMHERKQTMEELADAFIALPGGFGTLEELLEVLTLKQLGYHAKPIIILNERDTFDPLLEQFQRLYAEGFAHAACKGLYGAAASAEQALEMIISYRPAPLPDKIQHAAMGA